MEKYLRYYSRDAVDALDENTIKTNNISIFPRDIYRGELFPLPPRGGGGGLDPTYNPAPRDKNYEYLVTDEVRVHPDHPSRFEYSGCFNGYCYATSSPGKYNVNPKHLEQWDEPPRGVAPARFYNTYPLEGKTYRNARITRQLR